MLLPGDSDPNLLTGGPDQDTIQGFGGNDTLIGNGENDLLEGGEGDDILNGGEGNDTLIGGTGSDFYDGGAGDDVFILSGDQNFNGEDVIIGRGENVVDMTSAESSGGFVTFAMDAEATNMVALIDGDENLASIVALFANGEIATTEMIGINSYLRIDQNNFDGGIAVEGTSDDDRFYVDPGLNGWANIRPGEGTDEIQIEGTGFVRLDYSDASEGIFANLHFGIVVDSTPGYAIDEITGDGRVRELRGSDFDDRLYGSNADENFILRQGDDFVAGRGGDDLVRYDRSGVDAVNVNLGQGIATGTWDGEAFTDTLRSIEDVRGSRNDGDLLVGSGKDNLIDGRGGNDRLDGRGGNDDLFGGAGNDRLIGGDGDDNLTGGAGFDRFVFRDGSGDDTIFDFETTPGEDIILRGVSEITDFADLTANHLSTVTVTIDGNALTSSRISDGADFAVTLVGVTNAELDADDFLF